jgi:phosphoglycolate phosphatase-like HAD superfamily hydrolase
VAAHALIFDLDGTIWDSAGWFASGLFGDDADAAAALTGRLVMGGNIVRELRRRGMTREKLLSEAKRRSGPPPLFNGMAEVVGLLSARGTPLAVATNLPGTIAIPMLEAAGLTTTFRAVVHAGMCGTPKPHPASINMALRMIGQPASRKIFYVGDRATDATAASRAGVNSAWLRHGYEQPAPGSGIVTLAPAELLNL